MNYIGCRENNIHRVRKDIEKDIFLPLGDHCFQRSYGMKKESFYNHHGFLCKSLKAHARVSKHINSKNMVVTDAFTITLI
jgi:hypothetical protein